MAKTTHSFHDEQLIGVCVVVLDKSGKKVLLGKRKKGYKPGYFGVPGGRVDDTEKLFDCAKRELFEETGLKVKSLDYLGAIRDLKETYAFTHFAFLCKGYTGTPKVIEPNKCESWEWFLPTALPKNTLVGHKAAIDIFLNPGIINLRDVSSV